MFGVGTEWNFGVGLEFSLLERLALGRGRGFFLCNPCSPFQRWNFASNKLGSYRKKHCVAQRLVMPVGMLCEVNCSSVAGHPAVGWNTRLTIFIIWTCNGELKWATVVGTGCGTFSVPFTGLGILEHSSFHPGKAG